MMAGEWMDVGPDGGVVDRIVCSPFSTNLISENYYTQFISTDNGDSWYRFDSANIVSRSSDFCWSPWDDETIWIGTYPHRYRINIVDHSICIVESMKNFIGAALYPDPFNPGHFLLIANPDRLFESTDTGRTWTVKPVDFPEELVELAVSPNHAGLAAARCDGAIYVTRDAMMSWEALAALPNDPVSIEWTNQKDLVVLNGALSIMMNGSNDWIVRNIDFTACQFDLWNDSLDCIMVRDNTGLLHRSDDQGMTWEIIEGVTRVNDLDSNRHGFFAATGTGVWRSTDAGRTFQPCNSGLKAIPMIQCVIDPLDSSIWYGVTNTCLFRSSDEGNSWQTIDIVPKDGSLTGIYFAPYDPNLVFFSCHFVEGHRIYTSTDRFETIELFWVSDHGADLGSDGIPIYFSDIGDSMIMLDLSACHYHSVGTAYNSNILKHTFSTHEWESLYYESQPIFSAVISHNDPDLIIESGWTTRVTRDGGASWQSIPVPVHSPCMSQFPGADERYLIYGFSSEYDESLIVKCDLDTMDRTPFETDISNQFLIFDEPSNDYLFIGEGLRRSSKYHMRGIPTGDRFDDGHQFFFHPDDPSRLIAVWEDESVSEIRFERFASPPPSPQFESVINTDDQIELTWLLPNEATGTCMYLGETAGNPTCCVIIPDRQEKIILTKWDLGFEADYGYFSLSAYEANGVESTRTPEVFSAIGIHSPRIDMFGYRMSSNGFNRTIKFSALVSDPQGIHTIDDVVLLFDDQSTGVFLTRTFQSFGDMGIFEATVAIPDSFHAEGLTFQFEAVDNDGNRVRRNSSVSVERGETCDTYERPLNLFY